MRHLLLGLFCVVCLVAVAVPGVIGDRIEPRILGLPFALAWNVGWVALSFGVMLAFHLADGGERGAPDA